MKAICLFSEGFRLYADSSGHRNGQPLFLQDCDDEWVAVICLAVRICRLGTHISEKFASRYYDAFSAAIMVVPASGAADPYALPEKFFAMDSAYAVGRWMAIPDEGIPVSLSVIGHETVIQFGDMKIDRHVAELSEFMTLKMGDLLIYPVHVGAVGISEGDRLSISIDGEPCLDIKIK